MDVPDGRRDVVIVVNEKGGDYGLEPGATYDVHHLNRYPSGELLSLAQYIEKSARKYAAWTNRIVAWFVILNECEKTDKDVRDLTRDEILSVVRAHDFSDVTEHMMWGYSP